MNKVNNEYGTLKISDEVIAVCVAKAVLSIDGVYSLASGITDAIQKNILGKDSATRGMKINQAEDGIEIIVFIVVEFGVKIPSVAWNIQEKVKLEVEQMTGLDVKNVDIHIQGVHCEAE